MEQDIIKSNNVSDITYMSELTPHPADHKNTYGFLGEGLIHTVTYVHSFYSFHKSRVH